MTEWIGSSKLFARPFVTVFSAVAPPPTLRETATWNATDSPSMEEPAAYSSNPHPLPTVISVQEEQLSA